MQWRTWNLKSWNFAIVILAPSKFQYVEFPRFQRKSWNREIVILAYMYSAALRAPSNPPRNAAQSRPPKAPNGPRGLRFRESEG